MVLLAPYSHFWFKKFSDKKKIFLRSKISDSQMSRMGSLMPPVWCAMFFVYETSAIMVWKEKIAADRKLLRSLFF